MLLWHRENSDTVMIFLAWPKFQFCPRSDFETSDPIGQEIASPRTLTPGALRSFLCHFARIDQSGIASDIGRAVDTVSRKSRYSHP